MRVDDAGARTWLLAAVAGWAVVGWLLAVLGMGSRITPLPDDPALLKAIPALPASSASRLGPISQYVEFGARPLFATDRRPKAFSLQGDDGGADAAQEFDYLLTSVLITPTLRLALLQSPDGSKSERVKLGEAPESHPGWRLSALSERSAVFEGPGGPRTMDLRVFDGSGGQPPTAIARDGQPPLAVPIQPPAMPVPSSGDPNAPAMPVGSSAVPSPPRSATAAAPPKPAQNAAPSSAPVMTEQSQMEAIRQRIQARREQMRQQSQSPQPPVPGP